MTFKSIVNAFCVLCITAILVIAVTGCEDLGAYGDTEEYYSSFGDVVLIDGTTRSEESYSVEKYFYNKESREDFLEGADGAYKGVEHSDYVYVAIPFESNIDMDTIALYIQSQSDVTVYINVFVTDKIPSEWKAISDNNNDNSAKPFDKEADGNAEKVYDDPNPDTRIGEVVVHLKNGKWNSFVLDVFNVDGKTQKSIHINEGQYILLQIRNNSGVRTFDEEKQIYVDPQTGLDLDKAQITMTNLMIRAIEVRIGNDERGGE